MKQACKVCGKLAPKMRVRGFCSVKCADTMDAVKADLKRIAEMQERGEGIFIPLATMVTR